MVAAEPAHRPVVLVTGSSKGLGRYLAEHFLERGAHVEGCSRGAAEWSHDRYTHHQADVANEASVRRMLREVRRRHGRLDVLINNAGTASMNHALLTPVESADRIYQTNVRGVFLCSREAAKLMQQRRSGRIVTVSTVAVPLLLEGESLYAASKSAATTFTQVLAREVAPLGITCNVVGSPPLDTDLVKNVPSEALARIRERLAVQRPATMTDVAHLIDFLCEASSDAITGQVIYLGGV
jgi:3-oxoacyl-[acyl-carrier protein] reductase